MQDKMHLNDGVSIQLEQIEPWSDKLTPTERIELRQGYEAYGSSALRLEPLHSGCNHTVKTDVTSQYSLISAPQMIQADQTLQTEPIPKGTMILQCIECKEIFWEASS